MKKNLLALTVLFFITQQVFSQCTVTQLASDDTIVCGENVTLSAFGQAPGNALLSENFNSGNYGPGWQSTQQAMWNNPCGPGPDGTTHIWMGNSSPVPRILTTASFNLSSCTNAGVTICFDMKFATQGDNSPCEGPDEPNEGVYLQYSTDNGATWHDIHYFDPNGGYDPQFINWNNWCFPVPAVALTANTKFRWFQDADSGADYDHWGLDNVVIYCNDPTYNIVWQHDGYNAGPTGGTNPTPVAPHTTTSYLVTMSNGTTTCTSTVTVVVSNPTLVVDAGNDTSVCTGTCATLHATGKVVLHPAQTPTYSNHEFQAVSAGTGSVTAININVQGLNMTNILPNSITSVCIDNLTFFGLNIFPPSQVDIGALEVALICPSGTRIVLVPSGVTTGTSGAGYTNTCFVPAGGSNIASGTAPYSGNYSPNQPFNNLVGCTANGLWTMEIKMTSALGFGAGTFSGWSITFNDPEVSYTGNFNWSPTTNMSGSTTLNPTVCPPPTAYTLTVSDTAGCVTQSDVVNVTTHACCPLSGTVTRTQPTCGQSNGSINITPVPAGSYTFAWSDGPVTTQNRTGLAAGTYTVTVTTVGNTTCTWDTTIALSSNSTLSMTFSNQVDPTCAGAGNNGSITATLAGGTAPYTISVDTNGTPSSFVSPVAGSLPVTGLHGGTIIVSVTDAAGCTASATATLVTPNCCSLSATSTNTQPTCGQSNGTINITPSPAGNYTYAWSDGLATTQNRTGLAAGNYTVTITTVGNTTCTATANVVLNSNSTLSMTFSNQVDPTCAGNGNDGSITATLAGGTAPYTISVDTNGIPSSFVSPVAGSLPVTGLHGGTIIVSVTDAAGCTASATATLVTPNCCSLSATSTNTQPTCGQSNGTINITPSPAGNYTYAWSDGPATTQNRTGLAAGNYTVTVTTVGNAACTATVSVALNSNSTLAIQLSNPVNPTCAGGDGSVTATLSGGTAPYTISIDTNGTPSSFVSPVTGSIPVNGLDAVTINVSVTDGAGCTATATATLVAPVNCCTFTASAVLTQPTCGQADGSIALTTANGSGNYSYNWSPGGQTTSSVNGVAAGNYLVTITDNGFANCFIDTSFALNSNSSLSLAFSNPVNPTCTNNDGAVTVDLSGGTAPYNVTVDTGSTPATFVSPVAGSQTFNGLSAGTINASVTDAGGCQANATVALTLPAICCTIQADATVTPPACGQNNASVTVNIVTAGVPPYTYSSDGVTFQASATFSNLAAGNYNFVAADANMCKDTVAVVVPSSANNLTVAVVATDVTCFGAGDGTVTATPNAGVAPYSYVWNISGLTAATGSGLGAGNYAVTVTDAATCTATATASITEPAALAIALGADTILCEGMPVTITAPAGFTGYLWSSSETTASVSPTVTGTYTVTVTDNNGCTASDAINVTLVPAPVVDLGDDRLVYEGETIGIFGNVNNGTATGGNYNWMPDTLLNCANCPSVVALVADTITYTLIYTDDYGCKGSDVVTLNALPVGDVFWPNAFTPNGDGNNDIFLPAGSGVKQIQWQMFNRWGEKVFESNNFFYGCDGTYQGKPLPIGVYVYTAKIVFLNNRDRKYKGSVTLIR